MKYCIHKILFLSVLALLAAGCDEDIIRPAGRGEDGHVDVRMSLNVSSMDLDILQTRSPLVDETADEDNEVHNLWVLQFKGTEASDSLREARYYDSYDPDQIFKLIASSVPNRVVLVANTFDDQIAFSHCADMAEFMESFRTVRDESDLDCIVGGKHCALMSAYQDVILNEAGVTLDFDLKRTICKVNVTITNTTRQTEAVDIDINKVMVCSVPSKSFFFNSYDLPDRYPAKYDGDRIDYPAMDWTDGTRGANDDERSFTFYLPVNKSGVAEVPHNPLLHGSCAPDGATFLSIRGTYDDPADPTIKRPVEYKIMLGASETDFNLLPNGKYSYIISVDDLADAGTDSRETEQAVVDFCSWEHANTYMINPPAVEDAWKSYRIPVAKCYEFWNPFDGYYTDAENALLPGGYGWKAEVIWSEMPIEYDTNFKWIKDEGTDYRDWFEFALPYGFEHGTIVIGLRRYTDAGKTQLTDGFIWSWQMWVTDYDPYPALNYTPLVDDQGNELRFAYSVRNGDVHRYNYTSWKTGAYKDCFIMDRSLGALSVGPYVNKAKGFIYYQWGRKDPIAPLQTVYKGPAGLGYGIISSSATGYTDNVLYAIAHPNIYICGLSLWGTNYWQKTSVSANASLPWGDPKVTDSRQKSIYDPCPPGWRVPARDVLNNYTYTLNNYLTADKGFRYLVLADGIKAVFPNGDMLCDRGGGNDGLVALWCANGSLNGSNGIGDQNGNGRSVRCVTDKAFD